MTKSGRTLVYLDGGNTYRGSHSHSAMRKYLDKHAKDTGHIGYLSGWRYSIWEDEHVEGVTETVIVYFKEEPTKEEIKRRRDNGFKAARWHLL